MAVAKDKSWEYTLGRINERTENIEKRLTRVETDVVGLCSEMHGELSEVKDAMLIKGTFFYHPRHGLLHHCGFPGLYRFQPGLTAVSGYLLSE